MPLESLQDLYVEELKDLWSAERQLVQALPKMAKGASHPDLKQAFLDHLEETRGHVERLERIFADLDEKPRGKKCEGMEGLIKEGSSALGEDSTRNVRDAGLLAAAQHVEHYEMAGYGCVRTWAMLLGREEHARVLQQTLDEEGATDKKLTALAESIINAEAAEEDQEEPRKRGGGGRKESTAKRAGKKAAKKAGRKGAKKGGRR